MLYNNLKQGCRVVGRSLREVLTKSTIACQDRRRSGSVLNPAVGADELDSVATLGASSMSRCLGSLDFYH